MLSLWSVRTVATVDASVATFSRSSFVIFNWSSVVIFSRSSIATTWIPSAVFSTADAATPTMPPLFSKSSFPSTCRIPFTSLLLSHRVWPVSLAPCVSGAEAEEDDEDGERGDGGVWTLSIGGWSSALFVVVVVVVVAVVLSGMTVGTVDVLGCCSSWTWGVAEELLLRLTSFSFVVVVAGISLRIFSEKLWINSKSTIIHLLHDVTYHVSIAIYCFYIATVSGAKESTDCPSRLSRNRVTT